MNDAKIEQAVQEITDAFHHDGYERALEKLMHTYAGQPKARAFPEAGISGSSKRQHVGIFPYDAKTNQELKRWDKVKVPRSN
jgi:hypothetical protein